MFQLCNIVVNFLPASEVLKPRSLTQLNCVEPVKMQNIGDANLGVIFCRFSYLNSICVYILKHINGSFLLTAFAHYCT